MNVTGAVSDGLEHSAFHKNLDDWWGKMRKADFPPTVGEYNKQLRSALVDGGFDPDVATEIVGLAKAEQNAYGISEATQFLSIPNRTPFNPL